MRFLTLFTLLRLLTCACLELQPRTGLVGTPDNTKTLQWAQISRVGSPLSTHSVGPNLASNMAILINTIKEQIEYLKVMEQCGTLDDDMKEKALQTILEVATKVEAVSTPQATQAMQSLVSCPFNLEMRTKIGCAVNSRKSSRAVNQHAVGANPQSCLGAHNLFPQHIWDLATQHGATSNKVKGVCSSYNMYFKLILMGGIQTIVARNVEYDALLPNCLSGRATSDRDTCLFFVCLGLT
jgi:hypothetical protein